MQASVFFFSFVHKQNHSCVSPETSPLILHSQPNQEGFACRHLTVCPVSASQSRWRWSKSSCTILKTLTYPMDQGVFHVLACRGSSTRLILQQTSCRLTCCHVVSWRDAFRHSFIQVVMSSDDLVSLCPPFLHSTQPECNSFALRRISFIASLYAFCLKVGRPRRSLLTA